VKVQIEGRAILVQDGRRNQGKPTDTTTIVIDEENENFSMLRLKLPEVVDVPKYGFIKFSGEVAGFVQENTKTYLRAVPGQYKFEVLGA